MKTTNYEIKSRIWITGSNGTFLGVGRIALLKEVEKTGSISEAARKLEMSYKKAWESINAMNIEASSPLVLTSSGGRGGGGTDLTPTGKKMILEFENLVAEVDNFIKEKQTHIAF